MAKIRRDQELTPSVLDRLLDDAPDLSRETAKSRNQVLRELVQSVRRDLENLLNTRRRCAAWPPEMAELAHSLVNYGLRDITATNIAAASEREQFRRMLERTIRVFESRFENVHVHLLENVDQLDRTLRFRVTALLRVDPAPERVVFDSQLEPATGNFAVKAEDL